MTEPRRPHWGRIIGVVLLVLVLVAAGVVVAGWYLFSRPGNVAVVAGQPVTVEVPSGASTAEIAEILAEYGVVENANLFRLESQRADADGDLRAGVYQLVTGMSYAAAIDALLEGPPIDTVTVTIPEGWRIEQIAKRFEKQAAVPYDEFVELAQGGASEFAKDHPYLKDAYKDSLEGFLFPKTYTFKVGVSARDVIETMLDQFDEEIVAVDMNAAEKRGLDLTDVVTIASIVERETKLPKERELVSSVIENRLDIDMPLQMCSTVVYVLNKNEMRLTIAETKTESPYNTYLQRGLPPGPIASPGLASLQAAAAPADTDYIYYVLTGTDGSHTFAATNAEFLRAKQKSKEVLGE